MSRPVSSLASRLFAGCALISFSAGAVIAQAGAGSPPGDPAKQLAAGRAAIHARTGCYLVDYDFVETKPLREGYVRDDQVYDVNREKSVKEWIVADDLAPDHIRLQHVLLATDLQGKLREGSILRHTGEDWKFNAPFDYQFVGERSWEPQPLASTPNLWLRRVTSLDDGPRYDCAAAFASDRVYADWSCKGPAPIPGRETRDMRRHDYQMLDRFSRVIVYDRNWLERESNTKVILAGGKRTPLVNEFGKTWYVRLPDKECSAAKKFIDPRMDFWRIAGQAWAQVLDGRSSFTEAPPEKGRPSRYEQMLELEEKYSTANLRNKEKAAEVRDAVLAVIRSSVAANAKAASSAAGKPVAQETPVKP